LHDDRKDPDPGGPKTCGSGTLFFFRIYKKYDNGFKKYITGLEQGNRPHSSMFTSSVADPNPDPLDPYVFGPPGSGAVSGSVPLTN
jgi:hypothetical protein